MGLTGGIGSGKSTVARMLAGMGVPVVDTDAIAREVLAPGQPALGEVVAAFGPQLLQPDGTLDRKALARVVFADAEARRRLEAITHPRIVSEMQRRIAALRASGRAGCVVDVPLLFEAGLDGLGLWDEIWVVTAPPEVQLQRVMQRDGLDEAAARARLAAQWPLATKARRADRVIDNGGTLADTARQVEAAWEAALARVRST